MEFDPTHYGDDVARILALGGNGNRLPPLTWEPCEVPEARDLLRTFRPERLFPEAAEADAPMAGLWLYFNCFEEAHELADSCESREGNLWHAILHRQEGDMGNAAYWFRKAGAHPIYRQLTPAAARIVQQYPHTEFGVGKWDPFAFLSFCERARLQPGSDQARAAREIQRKEWQILFDYCARPQ